MSTPIRHYKKETLYRPSASDRLNTFNYPPIRTSFSNCSSPSRYKNQKTIPPITVSATSSQIDERTSQAASIYLKVPEQTRTPVTDAATLQFCMSLPRIDGSVKINSLVEETVNLFSFLTTLQSDLDIFLNSMINFYSLRIEQIQDMPTEKLKQYFDQLNSLLSQLNLPSFEKSYKLFQAKNHEARSRMLKLKQEIHDLEHNPLIFLTSSQFEKITNLKNTLKIIDTQLLDLFADTEDYKDRDLIAKIENIYTSIKECLRSREILRDAFDKSSPGISHYPSLPVLESSKENSSPVQSGSSQKAKKPHIPKLHLSNLPNLS
ncbi:MAG: hypothetical protein WCT85_06390 [Parachlamydiales bacterium]|jgi:hypothetical protein